MSGLHSRIFLGLIVGAILALTMTSSAFAAAQSFGSDGAIKLKLNKKGKALLKKKSKAKVALRITPKGGAPTSSKFTLKK